MAGTRQSSAYRPQLSRCASAPVPWRQSNRRPVPQPGSAVCGRHPSCSTPSSAIWQACYRCLPGGGQAGNNTAQPGVMRRGSPGGQRRREQGQPCRCYAARLSMLRRRCCPGEAAAGGAGRRLGPAGVSHTGPGEAAPRGTPRPPAIQAGCLPALQVLLQDGQALGLLAVVGDHGAGALDDLRCLKGNVANRGLINGAVWQVGLITAQQHLTTCKCRRARGSSVSPALSLRLCAVCCASTAAAAQADCWLLESPTHSMPRLAAAWAKEFRLTGGNTDECDRLEPTPTSPVSPPPCGPRPQSRSCTGRPTGPGSAAPARRSG